MVLIAVDIDDVLFVLNKIMQQWHLDNYGLGVLEIKNIPSYDLTKIWNCSKEEMIKRFGEFYASDSFKLLFPLPGVQDALKKLNKKHDIIAITSRPGHIDQQTFASLEEHFPGLFTEKNVIHTGELKGKVKRNKAQVCKELGVDIIIEDCAQYANECAAAGTPALLLSLNGSYGWNNKEQIHKDVTRVESWEAIVSEIQSQFP